MLLPSMGIFKDANNGFIIHMYICICSTSYDFNTGLDESAMEPGAISIIYLIRPHLDLSECCSSYWNHFLLGQVRTFIDEAVRAFDSLNILGNKKKIWALVCNRIFHVSEFCIV